MGEARVRRPSGRSFRVADKHAASATGYAHATDMRQAFFKGNDAK